MEQFIAKYRSEVSGVLSGWDRMVFRGTYRILSAVSGMMAYLWRAGVLLKEFGEHAEAMTRRLLDASLDVAQRFDRPVVYLASSSTRKEDVARDLLRERPIDTGLIGVLKCVEPCISYGIHRNRETKKLELRIQRRKCQHLYHYFLDPVFGFMHARIQTWFPFTVQVCLNGREWLARAMDAAGLGYRRDDNGFPWVEDFPKAQGLMDRLLCVNWCTFLDHIAARIHPAAQSMFQAFPVSYYWSAHQTEWATDLAFAQPGHLAAIYPQLTRGAMTAFSSRDVLRFLGRRTTARFSGEVTSDFKDRPEGIRVKHAVNGNSVKMYDKSFNLLRIETTINQPGDLKVYRTSERHPDGPKQWLPMRKGVADLHRRAQLSQKTNERYLDALSALDSTTRLQDLLGPVCRPVKRGDRRLRALRPWTAEDQALFVAILRPEFLLAGFRNRDLARHLYPDPPATPQARRRAAARVSYRLRLLRSHGLIAKLPNTRRYRVTPKGRQIATAAVVSQDVTLQQLTQAAA